MKVRVALRLFASLTVFAALPTARAEEPAPTFGDVQVQSTPDATEIRMGLLPSIGQQDRTKTRPGVSGSGRSAVILPAERTETIEPPAPPAGEVAKAEETPAEAQPSPTPSPTPTPTPVVSAGSLTVDEIHLFFRGASIDRARLITVGDRIVEEVRLFPDEGGVSMTVVVRRPVYYTLQRERGVLKIHVEPGTLLLAEPAAGELAAPTPAARRGSSRRGGGRQQGSAQFQGETLTPKIAMPRLRKGEGLTVDAEQLNADEEKNQIVAKGHVTIARAGSLLTADQVTINRDTQMAEAIGNVQLTDPQGTIQSDTFSGNLDDETGTLTNGNVFLNANHLTITGAKLDKSFGQTYHIENGAFTTCQCGVGAPSWSIAGKSIDVTLDGYGLIEGAKFKVLDTPILYLPYAAFPAKTTRQSGLLAPLFGYSKKRGVTYTQPLYLVINKSADATVSADVETNARVGGIGEYRYALDERSKGTLDFSYFNEAFRTNADRDIVDPTVADPHIPKDRWSVTSSLRQDLPFEIRAFADALAVSDDFFLREIPTFSFDPEYARSLRSSRYDSSRGGFYRFWDHATLIGQAVYFQDFIQEDDLTLQRLPQVQFYGSQRLLDRHLKLGLDSEFVDFVRRKGFDGPRLDLNPRADVPFRWQEYLNGTLGAQLRETAYHLNNTDVIIPQSQTGGVQTSTTSTSSTAITTLAKNPTRELFQGTATIGTQLARIFDVDGEHVKKLKHTLEPEVDYLFVPDVNQDDLPIYDFVDRINRRNLITYGVTSRLLAKLDQPPPIDERRPLSVGDLSPFSGVAPAPFDDENTRGGLAALGSPAISSGSPAGGSEQEERAQSPQGEAEVQTPEQRAAKLLEERAALSNVVEWARLQIFQSYDLRDSLQQNRDDHFSDVDMRLRLNPADYFSLLYDTSVNARDSHLSAASISVLLRDPRSRSTEGFLRSAQRASVGLSYRFVSGGKLEEVDGGLIVPLADTLSVFTQSRYDALGQTFLEKIAGFRLSSQCQCWILDLSVADRVNPQETEVRFQVTLIGLGSIGRSR